MFTSLEFHRIYLPRTDEAIHEEVEEIAREIVCIRQIQDEAH